MNEKFAHTPGPWRVSGKQSIRAGEQGYVAKANWDNGEANARLIAAAPDLLQALRALGSAFMSHTQWNGEPPAEILQARAAINKALGVDV